MDQLCLALNPTPLLYHILQFPCLTERRVEVSVHLPIATDVPLKGPKAPAQGKSDSRNGYVLGGAPNSSLSSQHTVFLRSESWTHHVSTAIILLAAPYTGAHCPQLETRHLGTCVI